MRVLIAPEAFGSTLGAIQGAEALATGWRRGAPHDDLRLLPLSAGGPGFVDVVQAAVGGDVVAVTVSDPLGRAVPAGLLVVDEGERRTAYVEAAQAHGLHLLSADERNPGVTSTWGVGELLAAAVDEGVDRIVVGVAGGATNDGGAGMLAALGAGDAPDLARGGLALRGLARDAVANLAQVRERFSSVDLVLATDDDTPLLGLSGTSAIDAPAKGASPQSAQDLESALGHFTDVVSTALPPPPVDLLTGKARRLERESGAGAGGGLGYGLAAIGARRVGAIAHVLRVTGFGEAAAASDLVVTATGRLDWAGLRSSVVAAVAEATLETSRPCVAIVGESMVGRRETMALGLSGCYAVADRPDEVAALVVDPVSTLTERTARVARTWSPSR